MKKIPVILDTDIGDDIDDTWALAMMLKSPELDIKLITTDVGDTTYRAKIAAKLLECAGRPDIPVGIGIDHAGSGIHDGQGQREWVKGYKLSRYPGKVLKNGVVALINTIMDSPDKVTLICIGPLPNIGRALELEPRIAKKARFVGMHGSVRVGYGGSSKRSAECNVACYTNDCQKVFTAPWDITITPVDTCGIVRLRGDKYRKVLGSTDPLIKAMIENYRVWAKEWKNAPDPARESSILFDTVAVHLASSRKFLKMEKLGIRVSDDGYTLIDPKAKKITCAMQWKDLEGYEDYLVNRLLG